jgi:hypothetical protein
MVRCVALRLCNFLQQHTVDSQQTSAVRCHTFQVWPGRALEPGLSLCRRRRRQPVWRRWRQPIWCRRQWRPTVQPGLSMYCSLSVIADDYNRCLWGCNHMITKPEKSNAAEIHCPSRRLLCSPTMGADERSSSHAVTVSVAHPLPSSTATLVAMALEQRQSAASDLQMAWRSPRSSCGRSPGRRWVSPFACRSVVWRCAISLADIWQLLGRLRVGL